MMKDPIDDLLAGSFERALNDAPDLERQMQGAMDCIRRRERQRFVAFSLAAAIAAALVAYNLAGLVSWIMPVVQPVAAIPVAAAGIVAMVFGTWMAWILDSA